MAWILNVGLAALWRGKPFLLIFLAVYTFFRE